MKRKRPIANHHPRRTLGRAEGFALVAAACAAGGAEAQDNAATSGEAAGTLPPEEVRAAAPAPAPRPAPRPAPQAPAPAPAPLPVIEPEPLVFDDSLYQVKTLSTTKYSVPLRDVPQTVQVIPEEVTKEQAATTLRDVLRNVPGITMAAGEGGGGAQGDNFRIRGFNSRSDIFVDGVRDYGIYNRDPFNYEQIEVYKGPASSNSGRGSAGGSLNLVTKTPKLDSFTRVDGMVGTDDLYRVTLDINEPLFRNQNYASSGGKGSYSGKGSYGKQGYGGKSVLLDDSGAAFRLNLLYHDQDAPGRDVVEQNRWGVAPSVAFGLGTDTRLTLSYLHLEEDNVPDYGLPFVPYDATHPALIGHAGTVPPSSFHNFYGLRGLDFEDITTDMVGVLFEHDFSDDVKVRNFTRYSKNDVQSYIAAPRFTNPRVPGTINRDYKARDQVYETWSNTTDFTFEFETGALEHTLVAGFEFIAEDQVSGSFTGNFLGSTTANRAFPATNLFNPNPNDPYSVTFTRGLDEFATVDTRSAYLFDTVEITDSLKYIGGLRYDHVELEINDRVAPVGRVDEFVSWRSALVYNPVDNASVYFGYGTSFSPSGDSVTGLSLSTRDERNATIDLTDVDPEKSQSFELGTKWDVLEDKLSLTGALFRTEKTDARTQDPVTGDITLDGEQVIQGFELGAVGNITDSWRIFAGYVYTDSEVTDSLDPRDIGKRLGNTPLHTFNIWSVHDLPGGFQVGVGTQYIDERVNNIDALYYMEGYWLVDAMLGYQVSDNLTLRLNVHNLLEEDYVDRPSGNHFVPGAGRAVSLSASMEF